MEVRSYRRVFDLERRIYRIDNIRLNPSGVPVRGVVFALAGVALALLCGRVPLLATLIAPLPWFVRDLVVPTVCAGLLTVMRVDGRQADQAAHAALRYICSRRHELSLRAGPGTERRWCPPTLVMLADGSDFRIRRMRFCGPGAVHVVVRHECEHARPRALTRRRGTRLIVRSSKRPPHEDCGRVIVLDRNTRLRTR